MNLVEIRRASAPQPLPGETPYISRKISWENVRKSWPVIFDETVEYSHWDPTCNLLYYSICTRSRVPVQNMVSTYHKRKERTVLGHPDLRRDDGGFQFVFKRLDVDISPMRLRTRASNPRISTGHGQARPAAQKRGRRPCEPTASDGRAVHSLCLRRA